MEPIANKVRGENLVHSWSPKPVAQIDKWKSTINNLIDEFVGLRSRVKPKTIYHLMHRDDVNEYSEVNWKRVHDTSLSPEYNEMNWRIAVGALTTKSTLMKMKRIT